MLLLPHNYEESIKKWEEVISDKLFMRPIYLLSENEIQYSRVAKQFLGIHSNTYDMQEYLYTLVNSGMNWTLLFNNLPKEIDHTKRTEIVNILQMHRKKPITLNRFMAFFAGKQLLPLMNTKYRNHFVNTLRSWLEFLQKRYPNLISDQLQRIFLDFVKWSNYYFPKWLEENDFEKVPPKILWYGPAKESEALFVYFTYLFGCDVVVFEPDGTDIFKTYGITDFPTVSLQEKSELFDFPFEKPVIVQTITSQAAEQVQQHLYDNTAINFPWKYVDYETRARILNTTYDELFLLSEAPLYLREGFADQERVVYLPVLFAKIEGVSNPIQEYAQKIAQLKRRNYTHVATKFPLLPLQKSNMQFHMRDASTNGQLDSEKIMQLAIWPFRNMSLGAQRNIAKTMIRVIESDYILPIPGQTRQMHEQYLFGQMLVAPIEIMRLYQQFDYSSTNPTMVVFKEDQSGEMQRQDAVFLVFLSMLGFDVFIFSPGATLSIEHYIVGNLLNTHRLEKVSFNETLAHLSTIQNNSGKSKIDLRSIVSRFKKKK
jgi:hypothetical protein